jgi:hypothetical protein
MDELVFTNPEGPKVTPHQRALGHGRLGSFHYEVATPFGRHQCIIRQGMTAGNRAFHVRSTFQKEVLMGTWRAGTGAQEFIEEFLWADSRKIVTMNGPAMENLIFECKARLHAGSLQLILDCFQKSTSAKRKRPSHGFFSDLIS